MMTEQLWPEDIARMINIALGRNIVTPPPYFAAGKRQRPRYFLFDCANEKQATKLGALLSDLNLPANMYVEDSARLHVHVEKADADAFTSSILENIDRIRDFLDYGVDIQGLKAERRLPKTYKQFFGEVFDAEILCIPRQESVETFEKRATYECEYTVYDNSHVWRSLSNHQDRLGETDLIFNEAPSGIAACPRGSIYARLLARQYGGLKPAVYWNEATRQHHILLQDDIDDLISMPASIVVPKAPSP